MNTLDFYTGVYRYFYPRKWLPNKVYALSKRVVKKVANNRVPLFLSKPYLYSSTVHKNLIVSFTSFPERINEVWQVVECIKRQTVLPEKILLWLSVDQFLSKSAIPESLKKREDDIFEIRWVKGDIKSHKKYQYVLSEFPLSDVILIDDDIHYPTNMVKELLDAQKVFPESILCRYGYIIQYDNNTPTSYTKWKHNYAEYTGNDLFFGSGGGTLLNRDLFYEDVLNQSLSQSLAPTADDVWLNAMARLNNTRIVMLPTGRVLSFNTNNKGKLSLLNLKDNQNDPQMNNVRRYYIDTIGIDPFKKKEFDE